MEAGFSPDVARIGPVMAYDRRALGQSEADTAPPTFTRTVETLRSVLQALELPPPYVLVGHSMGGVFIRGFASLYPGETAGMVYLDVPDFESTREERAAVLPAEDCKAALAPPVLPDIPPGTPAGLAAVYQQQLNETPPLFPVSARLETAARHSGCGRDHDAGGSPARQWRGNGSPADEAPVGVGARITEQLFCPGRAHGTSSPSG